MDLIHINKAREIIESGEPVSISFWTLAGEIIHISEAVCTSSYYYKNTFNLKILSSGQIRKVKAFLVFAVNQLEVAL